MATEIEHDVFLGDAPRLKQILVNLLCNAVKFTADGGSIALRVRETGEEEGKICLNFHVLDTGRGIAPEDQARIFESFEQLDTRCEYCDGAGLGLSVSRGLVELMGGKLCLSSQPGQGSDFYFDIHMQPGVPADKEAEEEDALRGASFLLAEDNDLNAEITCALLEARGAKVCRARNGRAALQIFEKSAPGEFDAILMDIMMPEMNGLEAARAIRGLERPDAKQIPIIAMTASALARYARAAQEVGISDFISKPIDVKGMYDKLKRALAS